MSFDTPIRICGPFRKPKQMLAEQQYDGHASLHDEEMAASLGFKDAPIEGATHFSQLEPLLFHMFGKAFYERGHLSAHFKNMVFEGEEVRAFAEPPTASRNKAKLWAEKKDGVLVLEAEGGLDTPPEETSFARRRAKLEAPVAKVIFQQAEIGAIATGDDKVRMDPEQNMGALYPFSLNQKLEKITERSDWYTDAIASPWGRAIIPLEMVSVLAYADSIIDYVPVYGAPIGLFADLEIRLVNGPLFVSEDYSIRRELVAFSEGRKTESIWVQTEIRSVEDQRLVADVGLHVAYLKQSVADYEEVKARLMEAQDRP